MNKKKLPKKLERLKMQKLQRKRDLLRRPSVKNKKKPLASNKSA